MSRAVLTADLPEGTRAGIAGAWRGLSLDAKVVGAIATLNWLLLFDRHTIIQATGDAPVWQLFTGPWGAAWLLACGLIALAYPLRDHRVGKRFTRRDRVLHLAGIVFVFVIVPAIAAMILRATGKPYLYVHDGAIMIEDAARKLLAGQNPYVADYVDTSLFYWPMINNPALYHLTYFPFLFLVTVPFVAVFDRLGLLWDERFLYVPAYLVALLVVATLVRGASFDPARGTHDPAAGSPDPARGTHARTFAMRVSLVAVVALDPQLFPFVAEGKNDFFVLCFLFAGIALLQRDRRTLGTFAIAVAAASKLHAGILLPFVAIYLLRRDGARTGRDALRSLWRYGWPSAAFLAATFVPFLVNDLRAFYDDVVAYNAGGAAWSYPISGMGFAAILRGLGVIEYPQQDFPFWALQLATATPLAIWSARALWRDPTIPTLLAGYAMTLLAFLFFGRYFHGNHLGFILAVAAPVLFLRPIALPSLAWPRRVRVPAAPPEIVPSAPAPVVELASVAELVPVAQLGPVVALKTLDHFIPPGRPVIPSGGPVIPSGGPVIPSGGPAEPVAAAD